ncbi:MAG: hypothetical protein JETT_2268 [Candidatus Jettenia ecosi]|uniref:Uncharacterized protein n=1 Tax=Candidatus Jettenia ecosi TaxID=2494326 RepID=A0A533Q9Y9_9BACT|nr:MAG: hypothetical protein JETT_2268 [Candidatus Jettenia ecosi]
MTLILSSCSEVTIDEMWTLGASFITVSLNSVVPGEPGKEQE